MNLKTRPNTQYNLTSYDIPEGTVKTKSRREIVWELTTMTGEKKVAVVCINSSCLRINIIEFNEVKPDGFVDRGKGRYGISCIKCKCGACYWPYLVGWKKAEKKTGKKARR